jgi:hypothetical protein
MCNGDLNIEGNKPSLKNNLINIQCFIKIQVHMIRL